MKTWFKPFYSVGWHLQKDGLTLCAGWRIFASTKREERPDDVPDNCAACLRAAQEQEGSVNGKD